MRCIPTVGMKIHRSRGMEIIETWPSFGHRITMTSVSVRNEAPGRLSEPISRKFTVSPSVRFGNGSGAPAAFDGGGGAAAVGKRAATSTVGLGSTGGSPVGEGVVVGSDGSRVATGAK